MYDSITGQNFGQQTQQKALVSFYMDKQINNFKSAEAGHAVYDDAEMIRIITPGDRHSEVVQEVKNTHKLEYKPQYDAFKAGIELAPEGTPLEHWPPISASPAQIGNLKALGIMTVEALAGVSDGNLGNIGHGARVLRDRAAAWLEEAKGGAPIDRLMAENERLKDELAVQGNTIAAMQEGMRRMEAMMASQAKPGATE